MKLQFINKKINYDGSQLRSHWIYNTTQILGDAVAAFCGKCDVSPEFMVDLVDKNARCRIYSEEMLHFIIECFDMDLEKAILHQRLFVTDVKDELILRIGSRNNSIIRRGNDLFDGPAKLNVSIATVSPVSSLIHVGINISSKNTPVKTKGLKDYKINPRIFAEDVMKRYVSEIEGVAESRCKVKGVK